MSVDLPPAEVAIDVPALIRQCAPNVAVQTLQPLIRVESAKRPHAIGYKVVGADGVVYRLMEQPKDSDEAKQWASWLLANGYRFDAGIAQINAVNFPATGLTVETMFDACANIRAGAQILTDCYRRAQARYVDSQAALRAALSCYQSGNFQTGFSTGYVAKVLAAAGQSKNAPPLKQVGMTKPARKKLDLYNVSSEVPGWSSTEQRESASISAFAEIMPATKTTEDGE